MHGRAGEGAGGSIKQAGTTGSTTNSNFLLYFIQRSVFTSNLFPAVVYQFLWLGTPAASSAGATLAFEGACTQKAMAMAQVPEASQAEDQFAHSFLSWHVCTNAWYKFGLHFSELQVWSSDLLLATVQPLSGQR